MLSVNNWYLLHVVCTGFRLRAKPKKKKNAHVAALALSLPTCAEHHAPVQVPVKMRVRARLVICGEKGGPETTGWDIPGQEMCVF